MDTDGKIFIIDKKYCLCKNCDLVYTNPTVDPKIFDKLYTNSVVGSFFDHKNSKNVLKLEKFDKTVLLKPIENVSTQIIPNINKHRNEVLEKIDKKTKKAKEKINLQ